MGREIRKVPAGWEHPKDEHGNYIPMYDEYYGDVISEWIRDNELWMQGKHPDQLSGDEDTNSIKFYAEYWGDPPSVETHRTIEWKDDEVTCFQYYENVTEGTPLSPVFSTLQELEDWLVLSQGHSRMSAHKFVEQGHAFSMIITPNGMFSGVDSCGEL